MCYVVERGLKDDFTNALNVEMNNHGIGWVGIKKGAVLAKR
jgi:hypothetical protein